MNKYIIFFAGLFFFLLTEVMLAHRGCFVLEALKFKIQTNYFNRLDLAKDADAVITIVDDLETEGIDRTTLALPGRTDELIARVAAVNAKTSRGGPNGVCCLVHYQTYF